MSRIDQFVRTTSTSFRYLYQNTTTERIAVDYLIYRDPVKYIIVLSPFLLAYALLNLIIPSQTTKYSTLNLEAIDTFHRGFYIALVSILALFLLYRWTNIRQDGSYGYWISLGINRATFITLLMVKFVTYIIISYIISLIVLSQFSGITLTLTSLLLQFIQVIGTTILLLGIALLISEFITNASITIIIFLSLSFLTLLADFKSILNILTLKNYVEISMFDILEPFAFGLLLLFITVYFHDRAEFDLR